MDPGIGFGENLEVFLIKGNLLVLSSESSGYGGDGSLEAPGTLYVNKIKKYDGTNDNSITINKVELKDNYVYIPHTIPSTETSASFFVNGGITIKTTQDSVSLDSGGGLTILGGASVNKKLNVGGVVNVNNNKILNVATPEAPLDGVNKAYVDSVAGRVQGDFTTGQVIIAASQGDAVQGYNTLTFDGNTLSLLSTRETVNLSSGGALISEGGVVFKKDTYINGTLSVGSDINANDNKIVNVAEPTDPSDAATKFYVDSKTYGNLTGNFGPNELLFASTDGSTITSYPTLYFSDPTFVIGTTENATGVGSGGALTISGGTSIEKDLYVGGILDMTNGKIKNVSSPTDPKEAANKAYVDSVFRECCGGQEGELTIPLSTSIFVPLDISELIYDPVVNAFVSYIYFLHTDGTNGNLHTFFKIQGLNNDGTWQIHTSFIGDQPNFDFHIRTTTEGAGVLQYTNYNTTGETTIKVGTLKDPNYLEIKDIDVIITLSANQTTPVPADLTRLDFAERHSFYVYLYVTISELELTSLYLIQGLQCHDQSWKINVSYVGDNLDIEFDITENGILTYTNLHNYDAICKFSTATLGEPLPVPNGGTGRISFNKNAILRGNLDAPIIATNDFVYENFELQLGLQSSILLKNTSPAINATSGGTFISQGGVGIRKNVFIGESLTVRDTDITPNIGDIVKEREFSAGNNIQVPSNITGFDLNNSEIKSYTGVACVTVLINDNNATQYDTLYEIKALRKKDGWMIRQTFVGDNTGIQFRITSGGQVQYTSPDFGTDWSGTIIKFRGLTTTTPQF